MKAVELSESELASVAGGITFDKDDFGSDVRQLYNVRLGNITVTVDDSGRIVGYKIG